MKEDQNQWIVKNSENKKKQKDRKESEKILKKAQVKYRKVK